MARLNKAKITLVANYELDINRLLFNHSGQNTGQIYLLLFACGKFVFNVFKDLSVRN